MTTIDIDEELVALTRERLASLGYHPSSDPQPGSYDRILATHSVDDIPAEWLRWGKPGAVILTDVRSPANSAMGAWAKVAIREDGASAIGALMPAHGFFMGARRTPEFAHAGEAMPEFTDEEHQARAESMETRPTKVPASVLETGDSASTCGGSCPRFSGGPATAQHRSMDLAPSPGPTSQRTWFIMVAWRICGRQWSVRIPPGTRRAGQAVDLAGSGRQGWEDERRPPAMRTFLRR